MDVNCNWMGLVIYPRYAFNVDCSSFKSSIDSNGRLLWLTIVFPLIQFNVNRMLRESSTDVSVLIVNVVAFIIVIF